MSLAETDWRLPTWPEFAIGVVLFFVFAALSLFLTGWVLIKVPADYFVGPVAPAFWNDRHPALRLFGRILRNMIGVALVILGIILSLPGIPGQGLLTILLGLMCLDMPGKRRVEQWFVGRPRIAGAINRLRTHYGKPHLVLESVSPQGERSETSV